LYSIKRALVGKREGDNTWSGVHTNVCADPVRGPGSRVESNVMMLLTARAVSRVLE